MTIKIEKETRWNGYDQKVKTEYYVWADGRIAAITKTEEEARDVVAKIKSTYVQPSTEVIHEEEI